MCVFVKPEDSLQELTKAVILVPALLTVVAVVVDAVVAIVVDGVAVVAVVCCCY